MPGLERDVPGPRPAIRELAWQVRSSLMTSQPRCETSQDRQRCRRCGRRDWRWPPASYDGVSDKTALLVDSIETVAELLGKEVIGVENSMTAPEDVGPHGVRCILQTLNSRVSFKESFNEE
jgi:hypothetical protein